MRLSRRELLLLIEVLVDAKPPPGSSEAHVYILYSKAQREFDLRTPKPRRRLTERRGR